MGHDHHSCGIFGLFLGFLTGAIWLLFAVLFLGDFLTLLGIVGVLATVIIVIIAIIGFLAFLIFGLLVFRKAWKRHY